MTLSATEIQPHAQIQYQPIYEYQDLVNAIQLLTERVEKLEAENKEELKRKIDNLRDILYRQQLKMQRVEVNLRI